MSRTADPRAIRNHWKQLTAHDEQRTPRLRIAMLASYTIDPIIPYIGSPLSDFGLHPEFHSGPYNQVIQECLAPDSRTAAFDPDIVVVAQRFEELQPGDWQQGLLDVSMATLDACERWQATLVAVLPAIPDAGAEGVGGDSSASGWFASAATAREHMRGLLAARPNVHVVDLEAVVRAMGSQQAYHPALFRHAKIPYREVVFHQLGMRTARVVRARFGDVQHATVVDLRGIDPVEYGDGLGSVLRWLKSANVPLCVLGGDDSVQSWRELPSADLVDDWVFDARATPEQLGDLAAWLGLEVRDLAVLRWEDDSLVAYSGDSVSSLGDDPEWWASQLATAALFDRIPATRAPQGSTATQAEPTELSLADFVAGLGTEVDFRQAGDRDVARIADMLVDTKDLTLGMPFTTDDLTAALADEDHTVIVGSARDRFGLLGTSVTMVLRRTGPQCEVPVFLVSCPALGKGVEQLAISRIVEQARQWECDSVVITYQPTGRNQLAIDFLRSLTDPGLVVRTPADEPS